MRLESVKLKEEKDLFFAIENETRDYGCIGHLRGDFGSGKEFWTTWFPHTCHELNDEHFKTIFDAVINELRSEGQVLSGRCNMFNYAHTKHDCKLTESIYKDSAWGFRILTRDYALYLRCTPVHGDYNFYCFCFDKHKLMNKLAADRGLPTFCYGYLPTEGKLIRIDFAESGYTPVREDESNKTAKELNEKMGVTPAQAEAMLAGSMFGWNVPAANPKNYDKDGKLLKKIQKREER